jgi:hypothetical protein
MLQMHQYRRVRLRRILSRVLICISVFGMRATAQEPKLAPPSQSVAPAIVTADSGIQSSGAGKNWSTWYQLGVGKAPSGYTISKAEFWLTGERTCGVFAECREVFKSDEQVVWEFRLQGNDESGVPRTVSSEGHIRVTYRPR